VTAPKRTKGDSPQGKRGLSGSVLVEFTVGIDGKPEDIKVVESGGAPLDEAVIKAVRTYRYQPATSHGVKVRVLQRARFNFK
jgi:TonB family protein